MSVGTVLPVTQQNVTHSWHLSFYQWYKISSWGIFSPIIWRFHLNFFLILIQFRKFLHMAFQKPLVSIFHYLPFPPHNPPILVSPLSVYKTIIYFCFVERFPTPFLVPYQLPNFCAYLEQKIFHGAVEEWWSWAILACAFLEKSLFLHKFQ